MKPAIILWQSAISVEVTLRLKNILLLIKDTCVENAISDRCSKRS